MGNERGIVLHYNLLFDCVLAEAFEGLESDIIAKPVMYVCGIIREL